MDTENNLLLNILTLNKWAVDFGLGFARLPEL